MPCTHSHEVTHEAMLAYVIKCRDQEQRPLRGQPVHRRRRSYTMHDTVTKWTIGHCMDTQITVV